MGFYKINDVSTVFSAILRFDILLLRTIMVTFTKIRLTKSQFD